MKKIIRTGNSQWFTKLSLNYTSFVREPWFLVCKLSRQPAKRFYFQLVWIFIFTGVMPHILYFLYNFCGDRRSVAARRCACLLPFYDMYPCSWNAIHLINEIICVRFLVYHPLVSKFHGYHLDMTLTLYDLNV